MIKWQLSVLLLVFTFSLGAQNASNPFELTPRLTEEERAVMALPVATDTTLNENPFELEDRQEDQATATTSSSSNDGNPFDLITPPSVPSQVRAPSPREMPRPRLRSRNGDNIVLPTENNGARLALTLFVLAFATISLIFFRGLYLKAYRSLFNDNLLSLLYREREAGAFGSFIITYLVFFLSGALFLSLLSEHFGWLAQENLWQQYGFFLVGLLAVFIGKHLLLAVLGYIFPIIKEIKRYSFTIMVFAIVLGMLLTFGSVLIAYTPNNIHQLVIYGLLGIIAIIYALRSLRGLFIANRFIFNYQFHFLSYICAVEIGPALCLYKFIIDF